MEQAVDEFLELLQKSTYEKRDWLNEGRRAVFHEAAAAAAGAGTLQLLFAEVNGQKAAALFNFDYDGRIWVYNSGLDPAAFGSLSLGVVLTAKAIERAIENGRTEFWTFCAVMKFTNIGLAPKIQRFSGCKLRVMRKNVNYLHASRKEPLL